MRNLTEVVNNISQTVNNQQLLDRHTMTWMQDALLCGVLHSELLDINNQVLRQQLRGLATLNYNRLSPELVSPQSLKTHLESLQSKLPLKYRRLKLGQRLIKDFYSKNDIMHCQKNNTMFISIPVTLKMSDQLFELHEIETFPLPIGSKTQATLVMEFVDLQLPCHEVNHYTYFVFEMSLIITCYTAYSYIRLINLSKRIYRLLLILIVHHTLLMKLTLLQRTTRGLLKSYV